MKYWTLFLILAINSFYSCVPKKEKSNRIWTEEERLILISGLQNSLDQVLVSVANSGDSLWTWKKDRNQWSLAEVVEHLILQDQAYYREIKVVSTLPNMPEYVDRVKGNDEKFLAYSTDPVTSKSDWDVTPTGRFCTKTDAIEVLRKVRKAIIESVSKSDADFRQVFTFRNIPQKVIDKNPEFYSIRQVRDLHQLVLNAIAHTNRHVGQMKRISGAVD